MFYHPGNIIELLNDQFQPDQFVSARNFILSLNEQAFNFVTCEHDKDFMPVEVAARAVTEILQLSAVHMQHAIQYSIDEEGHSVAMLGDDYYFRPTQFGETLCAHYSRYSEQFYRPYIKIFQKLLLGAIEGINAYSRIELEELNAIQKSAQWDPAYFGQTLHILDERWQGYKEQGGSGFRPPPLEF